jgi:hypothetical protein
VNRWRPWFVGLVLIATFASSCASEPNLSDAAFEQVDVSSSSRFSYLDEEIGDTGVTPRQLADPATTLTADQFRGVLDQGDDQALWYVSSKATGRLTTYSVASFQSLPTHMRTILAAMDIWAEVGNGGLPQYFFNGYHERWPVQREALLTLGQDAIVASTDEAFIELENAGIDLTAADASMDDLFDTYESGFFDRYDDAFFPADEDPIYDALLAYLDENLEAVHAEIASS